LPEKLSAAARDELERLGVKVQTSTRVSEVTRDSVITSAGEVQADLRIWAAGVRGADVLKDIGGLETTASNQLVVRRTMQTTRDDRIYALGDCCACPQPGSERPVPPRAQAAHQMAGTVFRNLKNAMAGKPLVEFTYHDHGSLVSLSQYSTVGSLMGGLIGGKLAIEGRLARFVYVSLYQMHLLAIHGWLRGLALIAIGHVNHVIRPRLKLH
jgi:NADH dehydrogenase